MAKSEAEVISTLTSLYGNCERLANGTYYVKHNGDELYIPADVDNIDSLIAYAPGSGGSYNDAKRFREMCNGNSQLRTVICIAGECTDRNNILDEATTTIENLGGTFNNVVYASFSASGIKGILNGEKYLEQHPDISMSIISCDGVGTYGGLQNNNLKNLTALIESQTPIVMIEGCQKYSDVQTRFLANGLNSYLLKADKSRSAHIYTNADMIDYLLLYAIGENDEIPANNCNYQLFKNLNEGTVDLDAIRCEDIYADGLYEKSKYTNYLKANTILLNNLDNVGKSGKVAGMYEKESLSYVQSAINSIRSSISASTIAKKTPVVSFSGGVLGGIADLLNSYMDLTVSIYNKIAVETKSTMSVAQSIIDMDLYLGGQTPASKNLAALSDSTTAASSTNSTNQTYSSNANQSSSPGGSSSSSAGSSSYSSGSSNQTSTPSETVTVPDGELKWKYDDGHKVIIEVKDNKISSMKFEYEYTTEEKLQEEIEKLTKDFITKEDIEKISINGNKAEIIIKESYFMDKEINEIKEKYFKGGTLDV